MWVKRSASPAPAPRFLSIKNIFTRKKRGAGGSKGKDDEEEDEGQGQIGGGVKATRSVTNVNTGAKEDASE